MRFILYPLFCLFSLAAAASTSITTPHVSGHWTLAGSPYLIYNDIKVDSNKSLTIDPGVDVRFEGFYILTIDGILHASGTALAPINFHSADTTGWSIPYVSTGGWRGIAYKYLTYFSPASDTSSFNYCNVYDVRYGSSPDPIAFYSIRDMRITNCNFYHNSMQYVICFANFGKTVFANNTIHDCNASDMCLYTCNNQPVTDSVINNNFYNNYAYNSVYWSFGNALFQGNNVYNNQTENDAPVRGNNGRITIRKNNFHNNVSKNCGAIAIFEGIGDIDGNMIHNNQHLSMLSFCGFTEGGGAILIINNSGDNVDSLYTIARNNVIVNNYSDWYGGAVNVTNGNIKLVNNTIANNSAAHGGKSLYIAGLTSKAFIKNNIFYGNHSGDNLAPGDILILSSNLDTLSFDYNWMEQPYYHQISLQLSNPTFALQGDTIHNIIGTNPGLVAPTTTYGLSAAAATANFALSLTSPCINVGDTMLAHPTLLDYPNNPRITGVKIDIGAYEYIKRAEGISGSTAGNDKLTLYPNPATDRLNISVPASYRGTCGYTVFSLDGKGMLRGQMATTTSSFSLDVHLLAPGAYVIVITGDSSSAMQQAIFYKR